jgi:hypothetical protein
MRRELSIVLPICLTPGTCGQRVAQVQGGRTVSVPVLADLKSGEIAFGLSARDFSVKDNRIEQRSELENRPQKRPLSLLAGCTIGAHRILAASLGSRWERRR